MHKAGRLVGSSYVSKAGIGQFTVASPDLVDATFSATLAVAAGSQSPNVSCFAPGSNSGVLRSAMEHGSGSNPMRMMSIGVVGGWPRHYQEPGINVRRRGTGF